MKVYLVNDCSYWPGLDIHHAGCAAVIASLQRRIEAAGHTIVHVCPRPEGPTREKIADCDWLIVNGEGTFRDEALDHEPGRIKRLRDGMTLAKGMGKRVFLVNTVWCNMNKTAEWEDLLNWLDGISVREPRSQTEIARAGSRHDIQIHPDEAYFLPVNLPPVLVNPMPVIGDIYDWNMSTIEQNHIRSRLGNPQRIQLTDRTWEQAVKMLYGASVYITGQHHGVYAACKARCPFVCGRVNTHKLSSLFEWAGVDIPFFTTANECLEQVRVVEERAGEFEKLFTFLEEQTPWEIPAS
jgi:hypothetical protein